MACRRASTCVLAFCAAVLLAGAVGAEVLVNGTFDTNVDGWVNPGAVAGSSFGWSSSDPHDDPLSGSMYVWTNVPDFGIDGPWQCAPATPGSYSLTSALLMTFPPPQYIEPFVEMTLDFFATPDCTGGATASGAYVSLRYYQVWETLSVPLDAPAGTQSARVRFLVGGTSDTWTDVANFDDVSLLRVPEPEAGALGCVALAALARRRSARGSQSLRSARSAIEPFRLRQLPLPHRGRRLM
jgi:hypothetical protein